MTSRPQRFSAQGLGRGQGLGFLWVIIFLDVAPLNTLQFGERGVVGVLLFPTKGDALRTAAHTHPPHLVHLFLTSAENVPDLLSTGAATCRSALSFHRFRLLFKMPLLRRLNGTEP